MTMDNSPLSSRKNLENGNGEQPMDLENCNSHGNGNGNLVQLQLGESKVDIGIEIQLKRFSDLLEYISAPKSPLMNSSAEPYSLDLDLTEEKVEVLQIIEKFVQAQSSPFKYSDAETFGPDEFGQHVHLTLQVVRCGVQCCTNREDRLESDKEFVKDLSENCGKLIAVCFDFVKTNSTHLLRLSESSVNEIISLSIDVLLLSTDQAGILSAAARFFVLILKPLKEKLTSKQIEEFGIRMTQHLRAMITEKEIRCQIVVKKANYFGKILMKFVTDAIVTDESSCDECIKEIVALAATIEEFFITREVELQQMDKIFSFYPGVLTVFLQRSSFPSDFVSTAFGIEVSLSIRLKILILSHFNGLKRKWLTSSIPSYLFDIIIPSLLQDVHRLISDDHNGTLEQILDQIQNPVCEIVEVLDNLEFKYLQESLLQFIIFEWSRTCCMVTIELIANIFTFIISIAPGEVVQEYLSVFSKPSMPPQIKFVIYPSIVKQTQLRSLRVTPLLDLDLISKFTRLGNDCELKRLLQDDQHFINLFWNRVKVNWQISLEDFILPICTNFVRIVSLLDADTIDVVISTIHIHFLEEPINVNKMVATCAMLSGFQKLSWTRSQVWVKLSEICAKLVRTCSRKNIPLPVIHFTIHIVCDFLDKVDVESEDMTAQLVLLIKKHLTEMNQDSAPGLNPLHSKQDSYMSSIDKKNPLKYLEVLERVTLKMKEQDIEFMEDERQRLNSVITELKTLIDKS